VKHAEISRELKVQYFVEGSVRKAGKRVRITAQLIDAATGYHVWAERYDRDLEDIFAVQDEVTQKIVDALAVKFTAGERTRLGHVSTLNLEAYDYYLRADTAYQSITKETPIVARQMYERAIALDPHFAAAYAAMSTTYLMEWDQQWSEDPATLDRAEALAQKAIQLDDTLSQAHSVLGGVYAFKRQHDLAIAENQAAIRLDPNNAAAHAWLAFTLNFAGRSQETPALIDTAMRLNPHYPAQYIFILGQARYLMGHPEEAMALFRRVLNRNPKHLSAHSYLAILLSERGQLEESQAEVGAILRISPQYSLDVARERALYTDAAVLDRYIEGLRKAGLK
jgi:Tfp pilus assembly protein PilF